MMMIMMIPYLPSHTIPGVACDCAVLDDSAIYFMGQESRIM